MPSNAVGLAIAVNNYFSGHLDPKNGMITAAGISGIPDNIATAIIGLLTFVEIDRARGVLFPAIFYKALYSIVIYTAGDCIVEKNKWLPSTLLQVVDEWASGLPGGAGLDLKLKSKKDLKTTMKRVYYKLKVTKGEGIPETGAWNALFTCKA